MHIVRAENILLQAKNTEAYVHGFINQEVTRPDLRQRTGNLRLPKVLHERASTLIWETRMQIPPGVRSCLSQMLLTSY